MPLNWGAVAVGGIAGIGTSVLLAIPVLVVAGADGVGAQSALILAGFVGQLAAGYAAGRFAAGAEPLHGGLAALLAYLVAAVVAIATGRDPSFLTLAVSGVVALVIGTAGAVLAAARRA